MSPLHCSSGTNSVCSLGGNSNPLLGETYECIRADKGFRFIAEKVCHHPPVLAFHSDAKKWRLDGHVAPTQKFWGRSMEVFVTGETAITFHDTGDTFTVKKPSSFVSVPTSISPTRLTLPVIAGRIVR